MSNLIKWDPFVELSTLQKQFFGDDVMSSLKGVNIPTTDVYTRGNQLMVEAHLPNFEQKDIDIQIEEGALIVSAERRESEKNSEDRRYVVRESSNSFYRRIALPKRADVDKIEAQLEDGVLRVEVPLAPLPEAKKVAIKAKSK